VVLVERPAGRVHLGVVLPRLRDHHQHGVRQRPAAEVQQFEHLVEGRRVRRAGRADREEPVQVAGDEVGGEHRLAGPHPVAVALDGVDLAVVGDEPIGVGQRPRREGVGREPRVHQGQLGLEGARRDRSGKNGSNWTGRQHALVDQGPRRQRREVDLDLTLGALAQAEGEPLQLHPGLPTVGGHEELGEVRHTGARALPDDLGADRHVAPTDDGHALLSGDGLDPRNRARRAGNGTGRYAAPTAYVPTGGRGKSRISRRNRSGPG
jgi:hypothetical protein